MAPPTAPPVAESAFLRVGREQVTTIRLGDPDDQLVAADAIGEIVVKDFAVERGAAEDGDLRLGMSNFTTVTGSSPASDVVAVGTVVRPESICRCGCGPGSSTESGRRPVGIDRAPQWPITITFCGRSPAGWKAQSFSTSPTKPGRPSVRYRADQLRDQAVHVALAAAGNVFLAQLQDGQRGPGPDASSRQRERGAIVGDRRGRSYLLQQAFEAPVQPRRPEMSCRVTVCTSVASRIHRSASRRVACSSHVGHLFHNSPDRTMINSTPKYSFKPLGLAPVVVVDRRVAPDAAHAFLVDRVDLVDVLNADDPRGPEFPQNVECPVISRRFGRRDPFGRTGAPTSRSTPCHR